MIKVLYVGEGAIKILLPVEGMDVPASFMGFTDNGRFISEPLRSEGIQVDRILPYEAREKFPLTAEDLSDYNVLILSDVSHDAIVYYSGIRATQVPQGPNRVKEIERYVKNGGGLVFCGGDFTYQGRYGMGRWFGTAVAKTLPVEILPVPDDRVEVPEGTTVQIVDPNHPIIKGLRWDPSPIILGYNRVKVAKERGHLLATIGEEKDPFITVGTYGLGKVVSYTSDPGPEWGNGFNLWSDVGKFWPQIVRWAAGEL